MARPKIRHLAIFARNPRALAEFYRDVLEMEIINSEPDGSAFFVSDGYLTLALLPHRLEGSAPVGINHFGFAVDDVAEISKRFAARGLESPKRRGVDRPYAEYRGADPEGNWFDLSAHGYEEAETQSARDRRKVAV
jgi:catechol 2,3-dioxygenase-like lactoylglutathione lyase family enzyme